MTLLAALREWLLILIPAALLALINPFGNGGTQPDATPAGTAGAGTREAS